jgi:hypothetical protein
MLLMMLLFQLRVVDVDVPTSCCCSSFVLLMLMFRLHTVDDVDVPGFQLHDVDDDDVTLAPRCR